MIKLLLIFLLPLALQGAKILSYNIYDRTDRADVMITFDTPYDGSISQSSSKNKIIIKLKDSSIESAKFKKLSSKYLYSLSITPMSGYTQIVASVPASVKLKASKTSDAYGLRLRFFTSVAVKTQQSSISNNNPLSNLPTKKDTDMSQSYYIVVGILIIGILILFFIRKKVTPKDVKAQNSSWLFKEKVSTSTKTEQTLPQTTTDENVSIRFQKNIDNSNSVVMLDFGEQSYLVLMGGSNILLDKFVENKPQTQQDFETILQDRHKELDEFLHVESTNNFTKPKEALDAYKERAASISYEV